MNTVSNKTTPRNAANFLEAQAMSYKRLGFSVTKACPLRCAHCSVSASPELGRTTMKEEFGRRVADQIPSLNAIGIEFIDFTGGEPTIASTFVRTVSGAAKRNGISCGIVTAAKWAKSREQAKSFVQSYPHIDNWDISTDLYHLPFVKVDQVRLAFEVLSSVGKPPLIRIAHHEPITYEEAVLIDEVHRFAGRRIGFQPIGPVGRGVDIVQLEAADDQTYDRSPCPTTGPLVQSTGLVAPCCAPLSHEEYDHPLMLGNAFEEPLVDIVERWRVHPLLQTIRLWGFEPIVGWLVKANVNWTNILSSRTCHQCVNLIREPTLANIVMDRASTLSHKVKLAIALKWYFGEDAMDRQIMKEASLALSRNFSSAN